jgi:hypothetical protein
MCIKILNCNSEIKYDSSVPLENQLKNSEKVVINFDPKDPDMDVFLGEMERLVKTGISCNVSLDVKHNNYVGGAKAKKQIKRLRKDLDLNEAIKLLVTIQSELDKKLENISTICQKR